jgi:hypothetical protein
MMMMCHVMGSCDYTLYSWHPTYMAPLVTLGLHPPKWAACGVDAGVVLFGLSLCVRAVGFK